MKNHIHLNDNQYSLYVKYGRPYKNIGLGLSMNDAIRFRKLKTDLLLEIWQQGMFGNGVSAELIGQLKVSEMFGINFNLGYKTKGFLLSKQKDSGLNLGAGICIYNILR